MVTGGRRVGGQVVEIRDYLSFLCDKSHASLRAVREQSKLVSAITCEESQFTP